jgi:hypothetical protein
MALIIGTEVATNGFESGASLRIETLKSIVENTGMLVTVASKSNAKYFLKQNWDLIIVVSFSCSKFLSAAREKTPNLWFDPTDSWHLSRISQFLAGQFTQLPLLFRDMFWLARCPKIDLLTFITERDASREASWWRRRLMPKVLPILNLDRVVTQETVRRLVFVGDGRYFANRKSLTFLSEVLKYLPAELQIHLFGDSLQSGDYRFIPHGYVPRSELYKAGDIHLIPISMGAGLKLKAAVPLWNGLPTVCTLEGANGLLKSESLFIANTPREFAEEIIRIIHLELNFPLRSPRQDIYERNDFAVIETWCRMIGRKES